MAQRFWIGGSGNTNDTAHWSTTSGGSGGASAPGSTDDAIFDANSFSSGSRTVTQVGTFDVKSMDFTGSTNNPIFTGSSITVRGDLTLISGMTWTLTGTLTMTTTGTTCNLTTGGVTLSMANLTINGTGIFNHQSACTVQSGTDGRIQVTGGLTYNTNNNNLTCRFFQINSSSAIANIGSSTITLNPTSANVVIVNSGATLNAGTSHFVVNNGTTSVTFAGGGKTFYDVTLNGTPVTITGCNTYHTLTIAAGKTVNFPHTCTQTIDTLSAVGTQPSPITFRTTSGGGANKATLSVTTLTIDYIDVKDNIASGAAAPFENFNGTDSGNNTNWKFIPTQGGFFTNFV